MIIVRQPRPDEMQKYFYLRWKVLRAPWGQPQGTECDDQESDTFQLAAIEDEVNVVACGRLQFNNPDEAQVRYMAVDPDQQGKGLGKKMMEGLEAEALQGGAKKVILHARENAIPFYESCGYHTVEKSYLLFNTIQHYLMEKSI